MSSDLNGTQWSSQEAKSLNNFGLAGFDVLPVHQELFISHGDWMRRTRRAIGVRSAALKQLDDAILRAERLSLDIAYIDDELELLFQRGLPVIRAAEIREAMEKEAYRIVRNAFENWAKSEGDWRESRRDHEFAPTQVYIRLIDLQKKYPAFVPDSDELVTAGSEFTAELFRGSKVQVRGADLSNVINTTSEICSLTNAFGQLGPARKAFEQLLLQHFGTPLEHLSTKDPTLARALLKVMPSLTAKIDALVKLIPGVGVATSTVSALSKLYDVHTTDQHRTHLLRVSRSIPQGDARTALGVIKSWQDRYICEQKIAAMADAGSAGMQLATILMPAGQPISTIFQAAKSLAEMMNVIVELGIQYRESRALENYLLQVPAIDTNIFAICPLVGAYYVLNVPFSVFSLHIVPFDSPTFFADTEHLRQSGEMKAVLVDAERLLDASKFILTKNGLPFRSRESMSASVWGRLKASQLKKQLTPSWFPG
jgi:hypothetical protein